MKQSKKRMMTAAAVTAAVAASILGSAGCGATGASTTGAVSVPDTIRVENVEGAGYIFHFYIGNSIFFLSF